MSKEALLKVKDSTGTEVVPRSSTAGVLDFEGDTASGSTDSGNPVKTGGVARTANPTAVTNAQRVNASFDKLGRQITVPYQIRELISTAYVTLTGGSGGNTETTLLASAAGQFLDLVRISCANTSTASLTTAATAVQIDIRDATSGGIVHTIMANSDSQTTETFSPPLPQNTAAATWTIKTPSDISAGTSVTVSAVFVQNT